VKELANPVTLQLGCSSSRSKINFSTKTLIVFGTISANTYLDIANLDKYNTILGMLFMRKHGISLDFESLEIVIRRKLCMPTLPEGEGATTAKIKPKNKEKLNHNSTIILESDDDEHIVLDRIKVEETHKSETPSKTKPKDCSIKYHSELANDSSAQGCPISLRIVS
jgi:hypothetical protein